MFFASTDLRPADTYHGARETAVPAISRRSYDAARLGRLAGECSQFLVGLMRVYGGAVRMSRQRADADAARNGVPNWRRSRLAYRKSTRSRPRSLRSSHYPSG
jgi:hypothetical protein